MIQAAGFGRGAYNVEKYMAAWVKETYPAFKSWPKLAKALQIGIAAGTGGTKGASQSYAEKQARRAEQAKFKAQEVAKEKDGSIFSL